MWRALRGVAYLGWAMAMLHGLESGTDSSLGWVRWLYVVCGCAVAVSAAIRAGMVRRPDLVRVRAVTR